MKQHAKPEDTPRPDLMVVVDSLTPEFELVLLKDAEGYRAGETRPVYGGIPNGDTWIVYSKGDMPREYRYAMEEDSLEKEVITSYLPSTIEEINLKDYPKTYRLKIKDCMLIQKPQPEGRLVQFTPAQDTRPKARQGEGREVEHPATTAFKRGQQLSLDFPDNLKTA